MEKETMFEVGDAIIHPVRGAGVVERIEERQWRGGNDLYYTIKLLDQPGTKLMVPTGAAESIGLRRAIPESKIGSVWQVLHAAPKKLPANHKKRYKLLDNKLHTGNVFEVAEVVRDMAWRRQEEGNLTTMGKRRYGEGMRILAGEIAAVKGIEMEEAEAQIHAKLEESIPQVAVA